jgi:hypothetical protein
MPRKRATKSEDPFRFPCSACGARVGRPCNTLGNDSKPLVSKATRLVHAARLEGAQ